MSLLDLVGSNIRRIRLKRDLSQEQLAEKAELHRTYIGMIERSEKNLTLTSLEKIAEALGVPIHHLLITDNTTNERET